MKNLKVVAQRSNRPAQTKVETSYPRDFSINQPERDGYLTVADAMAYVGGFTSAHAFRMWVTRAGVRKGRVGRQLRFRRRDLDEAIQPPAYGREKRHA